ncbi:hypothetical protein [Thiomicrorhabdus chilensis]|uniref:hypothetical protein n=1 Tax=Thiomicrorhabdus chilensis TaxID=63656 RepID=UPI00048E996C|nr:hypothetical protein [Thiomicrorhabdus chilensis]
MQYQFKIKGFTETGNPGVTFSCEHCGRVDLGTLTSYMYSANLKISPRENIQGACNEFIERINSSDFDIFPKKKTAKKLKDAVCNCNHDVIDIEYVRAVRRAQGILKVGLEQMSER